MHFTYHEVKESLYITETLFGTMTMAAAVHFGNLMKFAPDPLAYLIPAVILAIVGIVCLVFGVWTYHFKDDPDLWH